MVRMLTRRGTGSYWQGGVDSSFRALESRLLILETTQLRHTQEMRDAVAGLQACLEQKSACTRVAIALVRECVEKRGRFINIAVGGLGVLYVVLQLAVPFLGRMLGR